MSTRELPEFLKQGFPGISLPPAKCRPGALHFPEIPPPREPCGQDRGSTVEWAQREWERLVDAGLIGGIGSNVSVIAQGRVAARPNEKAICDKTHFSQTKFAESLRVPVGTVRTGHPEC